MISSAGSALGAEALHVYSHRHYEVDQKVNDLFTEKTGIEVKVVNAEADQLIERLKSEGKDSPADVLVTVDAARMQRAVEDGLLQPVKSEILEKATPVALRDAVKVANLHVSLDCLICVRQHALAEELSLSERSKQQDCLVQSSLGLVA
jgi:ABC-type thiamine transport system substrate-binding protein